LWFVQMEVIVVSEKGNVMKCLIGKPATNMGMSKLHG